MDGKDFYNKIFITCFVHWCHPCSFTFYNNETQSTKICSFLYEWQLRSPHFSGQTACASSLGRTKCCWTPTHPLLWRIRKRIQSFSLFPTRWIIWLHANITISLLHSHYDNCTLKLFFQFSFFHFEIKATAIYRIFK